MKIEVEVTVRVEKTNGEKVLIDHTYVFPAGDNPAFERGDAARAVQDAADKFIDDMSLGGTRPL